MKDSKKRAVLIHMIGIVIARAAFFGMNPLAIGYFAAAYTERAGGTFAFVAAMIGIISIMQPIQILKYLLTMIIAVVIFESPLIKKREVPKPVLYLIPSIALGIFSLMEAASVGLSGRTALLAFLEAVISYVTCGVFQKGMDFILHAAKGYKMNNEQMVSMAVLVAVMIYAVPNISNDYIAPVETVIFFAILFFTYKYGVGQGTITGAVSGFALNLRGASMTDIGLFTMMGIIPSVFREMGRLPTAAVYMITAALMGNLNQGMEMSVREIGALMSAVIIFLLLPRSIIYRVDTAGGIGKQELLAAQSLRKIAKTRMKIFSDSFLKLSKTLETITEKQTKLRSQEVNRIFEDISEKLCKNCNNCTACWDQNFQETYQAANRLFDIAEKNGVVHKEDIPAHFLADCICADEFIEETNRGFEIAKLNHVWHNRITESREVIAEQLKEVSSVIQDITGEIYSAAQASRADEERIARRLRAYHIHVKDITVFERSDHRKEIYLSAAARNGRCITAKEAAVVIGEALGLKIKPSEASKTVISKEYDNFIFVEDTKFKVLTGVARAMKENVSGDNFSILKLENGEVMVALSDGMGTGKEAGEESETVMSLLEQMIEAGFKAETAIKLINSSLVLKSDKQTFSTVDISIINLFTGMCEFIKIGAASAFIKRDNWVETISSTTLPIGMFGNVDYDTVTKKLYDGDIVILVTDGVLDSIQEENKEGFMEKLLMEIKSSNPQEIANRILDRTLTQTNYVPMDDMSVITAGLWLK
ncbi:MAG TPA: stage II sporulation protein E [Mobilitalea sp.]|nr:stage II sporulation protein E [Mobilitalea sp.]